MKLFYKIYSHPSSNEYVFILHGLFGMLDNWHNMARKLSVHWNVVTVDQRNHGKSPHSSTMSFEDMAADLSELMIDLNIEKAHIIGHSMGGKTVMKFVDLYPDMVDKLVIVDIAPRKYRPGHTAYFNAFNTIDFSQCASRKEADVALAEIESNMSIRQFLLKNLDKAEVGYKLKLNLKPIQEFYPTMIDAMEFQWLINTPTLFVYGARSGYISEEDILHIEDTFTNASFEEIQDAGHWVHAEKPLPFLEVVTNFLQ